MIALRTVRREDRQMLLTWRNLPDVAKYMYSDQVISQTEHDRWFAGALEDPSRRYWIIQCDGADVGLVNLYDVNPHHRRASWAFYLGSSDLRGKGVGSAVEFIVLEHVFRSGHEKLYCEVLATNESVVMMHKSFGFVEEGRLRSHILKPTGRVDVVCLGILRKEWDAIRTKQFERLQSRGVRFDANVP